MIQFRFRSGETGVSEAVIEMLVQHLREWPITREFYITKLSESGFAVLIEGVALPDDVQMLEDRLRMHLELPLGAGQTKGVEYILASASFPYDTREVSELWGVVAKRLALRKKPMERDSVRPQVSLLESGIIRVDYGMAEGVTYELMREAFQIYQDEIAPDYPGVKFPQLTVAGRMVSLDPKAIQFTRSKMLVDVTTAIAVPPKGHIEKHIMRMFSYYNQPPYPFRICDTEDEAAEWLSNYVDPMFWQIKQQKKTA